VREVTAAVAQIELVLLALATPFLVFPGVLSSLGLALIGGTWGTAPQGVGGARETQDEPSGGESLPDGRSQHGAGRSAIHI
jgi:hypothetical protein